MSYSGANSTIALISLRGFWLKSHMETDMPESKKTDWFNCFQDLVLLDPDVEICRFIS